jgi:hypothetical protein
LEVKILVIEDQTSVAMTPTPSLFGMAADQNNHNACILNVWIDSPANGATLNSIGAAPGNTSMYGQK